MIYVSMIEIFAKVKIALVEAMGPTMGAWATAGGFLAGMVLMAAIDRFVPSSDNPHEIRRLEEMTEGNRHAASNGKLMRMGMFTAMAIAVHRGRDMRLVIVRPLSYRPAVGRHLLYRDPVYLICTDPELPPTASRIWR